MITGIINTTEYFLEERAPKHCTRKKKDLNYPEHRKNPSPKKISMQRHSNLRNNEAPSYPPIKASKLSARKNLSVSITILFDGLRNRLRSMDVKVLTDKYMEAECCSEPSKFSVKMNERKTRRHSYQATSEKLLSFLRHQRFLDNKKNKKEFPCNA
jgi:hypothetical protein